MKVVIDPKPPSFAECITQLATYPEQINLIQKQLSPLAQQLPTLRTISWDQSIINAIDQTKHIKPEEITAHLDHATFPFKRFWIEGPTFLIGMNML